MTTYSLADLAVASGVTERTIRYYQAEKLLPHPGKRGRDAVYGTEHLERLAIVGELRDRGLTLTTIRDLVASSTPTRTVSEWLGIDATLTAPWSDDRPATMSQQALAALVAEHGGGGRPGTIGDLQAAGYVSSQTDSTWLVPSPSLLRQALQLQRAGIDIDISAEMRDLLRRRLSRVVDDTVKLLVSRAGSGFAGGASPEEIAQAVGALRPIAREVTGVILAEEVERALAALAESGPKGISKTRRR